VPKARALPRPKPAPKPKIVAVNDDAPVLEPLEKVGEVWPLTPRARPMLELAARDCKFPVGEATGADLLHCGEATEEGCVYCAAHAAIAFLPQAARKERDFKRAYLRLASL
jgi:GcrA cell cycle regulator